MQQRSFRLAFFGLLPLVVWAQRDTSLLLRPERLTVDDIIARDFALKQVKVQSATRSAEDPSALPFSTWVITSEEILRYGFITLGDVLKAAPGIRVSQPGNALEGETFLMRGMAGNQQVKILINDVPVKPSGVPGMPIGAQLPIRQAERIEVVYSPAGVLYGNETCAGVVNIILKESERPIFTQADLNFGSLNHNNLDLMFGGKLFRDKNVLHFSIYGSSTVRNSSGTEQDTAVYNLNNYLPFGLNQKVYELAANFEPDDSNPSWAKVLPIPHESRLFGMNLKWHGFRFSFHNFSRRDASHLGYSPLAISYSRSGNEIKEQIRTYALHYKRSLKTFEFNSYMSFQTYGIEPTTTGSLIFDQINFTSFVASGGRRFNSQNALATLYRRIAEAGSNGPRFGYARGSDLRIELRGTARMWRSLYAEAGVQVGSSRSYPYFLRYTRPVDDLNIYDYEPFNPRSIVQEAGFNQFGQLDWRGKKLRVIAGASQNFWIGNVKFLKRLAAIYHIDSTVAIFANYTEGLNYTLDYQRLQVFEVSSINTGLAEPEYRIQPEYAENGNFFDQGFKATTTENIEAGARFGRGSAYTELSFFHLNAFNIVRQGAFRPALDEDNFVIGHYQHIGRSLNTWGLQFRSSSEQLEFPQRDSSKPEINFRADIFVQYARGREWFGRGIASTSEVLNQPRWTTQFRISWRMGSFQAMIATNRQTSVLSKSVLYAGQWERSATRTRYPTFRSTDLTIRYYLNKNFVLYAQGLNIWNRNIYGLDATGTQDDLLLPLQPGRQIRLGVNYNMN